MPQNYSVSSEVVTEEVLPVKVTIKNITYTDALGEKTLANVLGVYNFTRPTPTTESTIAYHFSWDDAPSDFYLSIGLRPKFAPITNVRMSTYNESGDEAILNIGELVLEKG